MHCSLHCHYAIVRYLSRITNKQIKNFEIWANNTKIRTSSRTVRSQTLMWVGPDWLCDSTNWPEQPIILSSKESEKGARLIKSIMLATKSTF